MPKICILGAGVVGLSTAVNIQELLDVQVTIIADKFDSKTLSNGAAGIFRPHATEGSPELLRQWYKDSWLWYKFLADSAEASNNFVYYTSVYMFSNKNKSMVENSLAEEILPVYRPASAEELKLYCGPWKYGSFFTTVMIECRKYLPWLMKRFQSKGGIVINQKINALKELIGLYDIVVNCTSLQARELVNDPKVEPVRGQILRIYAPWVKHCVYVDDDTYIITAVDSVVLGGTRQLGQWDEKVNPDDSQKILERCIKIIPSLKNATVLEEWAGLRPYRNPIRLETEVIQIGDDKLTVVHNYGHGGNGVTMSWGCGKFAANLVKNALLIPKSKI